MEDLCDTLRSSVVSRSEYIARAENVEERTRAAASLFGALADLGTRDTFPFEERSIPGEAVKALCADDIDRAKQIVARHSGSVWIGKGESQAQWGLVEAGLRLVEGCDDAERQLAEQPAALMPWSGIT